MSNVLNVKPNAVVVPMVLEEEKYLPKYENKDSATMNLIAKIPVKVFGGVQTGKTILLSHRSAARIETGIKVAVPHGYKLCVSARDTLAEKGLIVTNAPSQTSPGHHGPLEVLVMNVGRELIEIKDGDYFAQCWIEKVLKIEWDKVTEFVEVNK